MIFRQFFLMFFIISNTLFCDIRIPQFSVQDQENKQINLDFSKAEYTVIILMDSKTCIAYYNEKSAWEEIYKNYSSEEVQIFGIFLDDVNIKEMIKKYNFIFPIYKDKGGAKKYLDYGFYPMKFIIDKNGKLLYIGLPTRFEERKNILKEELDYIIYFYSK